MCIQPMKISDVGYVACRECWQCRETRIDDWVGRCIAETKIATAAHVVTLTYGQDESTQGPDHIRAAVLTYSDVQKFIKRLRSDGFPCRYFAVGEYGSKKGRAHWHVILFWQEDWPDVELRKNIVQKHWTDGWSYWDIADAAAVRYACKYLLKDPADNQLQGYGPKMSRFPPLGYEYFKWLAEQYVRQGISPRDYFYSFPDVTRVPDGRYRSEKAMREARKPIRFHMTGVTAENFMSYFVDQWDARYGDDPPASPVVTDYLSATFDEGEAKYREATFRFIFKGPMPKAPPFEGDEVHFDDDSKCYYSDTPEGRWWYALDHFGRPTWLRKDQEKIVQQKRQAIQSGETVYPRLRYREVKEGEVPISSVLLSRKKPSADRRTKKPRLPMKE